DASNKDASNKDASDNDDDEDAFDYPSDKDASASRVAMLKIVLDVVPFVHDSCFLTLLVSMFLMFS
ncbi:hypothetical protein Tco_1325990, partial [Tanacetum coccineum]